MRFSVSLGSLTSKNRRATPIGVESNAATQSRRFFVGRRLGWLWGDDRGDVGGAESHILSADG